MISLNKCNPFVRVAMKQEAVMEGDRPRIPYDNRIFFICVGNGDIILNGERIEIGSNTLIFLGVKDNYYFDGKFQAMVINFDMTMDFSEYKTPICPVPEGVKGSIKDQLSDFHLDLFLVLLYHSC